MKVGEVKTFALLMIFGVSAQVSATQVSSHLPVTIEVKQDVEVTEAYSQESRGKLHLDNVKAASISAKKRTKISNGKDRPRGFMSDYI